MSGYLCEILPHCVIKPEGKSFRLDPSRFLLEHHTMKAPGTGTPCIEVPASSHFFRFQKLTEAGWFFSIIFGRLKRYLCRPQATGPSFSPIPNLFLSYRQPGSNNFPPAIPQQLTIAVPAVFNTRVTPKTSLKNNYGKPES